MSLRCASLGSGSKGNATLVATDNACVLVDCGFGLREVQKRLMQKSVRPEDIDAIFVTHEHGDHSAGVAKLSNRFDIPVFLSRGTYLDKRCQPIERFEFLEAEAAISIADLTVFPFIVPHDAREPMQFRFHSNNQTLSILTDTGHITPHIIEVIEQSDCLLLEFNHDKIMLANGEYPPSLKRRVGGDFGHLSNCQTLSMFQQAEFEHLKKVVALHLSEKNNSQELVKNSLQTLSDEGRFDWMIADQTEGFEWLHI